MRRLKKRRKHKYQMSPNKHFYNLVGGIRKRCGLTNEEVSSLKAWLDDVKQNEPTNCEYCSSKIKFIQVSIDHRQPMSRGGTSSLDNLCVCCKQCNQAKGNMTEVEWRSLLYIFAGFEDGGERIIKRLVAAGNMYRRWGHGRR